MRDQVCSRRLSIERRLRDHQTRFCRATHTQFLPVLPLGAKLIYLQPRHDLQGAPSMNSPLILQRPNGMPAEDRAIAAMQETHSAFLSSLRCPSRPLDLFAVYALSKRCG